MFFGGARRDSDKIEVIFNIGNMRCVVSISSNQSQSSVYKKKGAPFETLGS